MELQSGNPKIFETISLRLKELQSVQGKVGWFEDKKYEDGTPVAYVAAIQEFGSVQNKIPPRPFMRPAVIEQKQTVEKIAADQSNRILAGKATAKDGMEILTDFMREEVAEQIATVMLPPLSPITIVARKFRKEGKKVTGKTIGEIASGIKAGKTKGLFNVSGISTKPLNDTGYMLATLSNTVEDANS